jgi:hypothetical protein
MADEPEHAIGYQVLPRGTPVEASDGVQVGTFDKAIHHPREHMLDGIVIQTQDGKRFVDAPEVARITNLRITLVIDSAEVKDLLPYRGALGRMSEAATRRTRRRLRRI